MTLDLSFRELVHVAANPGAATGRPLLVAIDCIDEDPGQPRRTFSEQELEELSQSIAEHGVLQPIVLRRSSEDGRSVIAMGARRYRAAQRAGLREMPAFTKAAGKSRSRVPVSVSAFVSSAAGVSVFAMPTPPSDRDEESSAQRAGALDRLTVVSAECRECWFEPTSRGAFFLSSAG
ncbi:ParB/RepB/Spo0J family partition protein [Bradyrhizobium sp. BR 10261]|uniref:ParB/RepB/Spo0J family partition protein n=1 Tax=Bradyrhizobium sp. BR 10261 TaxID=2749992 RepID=UPI001C647474|nr:ParB/RepB/Spo0J family partition protein [Bradyrhizobium sp. BR 10261]MBW7967171.1 ParB/RepB/Spo0J family partition protein [Bradyrhizobium sp. BR 10261]